MSRKRADADPFKYARKAKSPLAFRWVELHTIYTLAADDAVSRVYSLRLPNRSANGAGYYHYAPGDPDCLSQTDAAPGTSQALSQHFAGLVGAIDNLVARYLGELRAELVLVSPGDIWDLRAFFTAEFVPEGYMRAEFWLEEDDEASEYVIWRSYQRLIDGSFDIFDNDENDRGWGHSASPASLRRAKVASVHDRFLEQIDEFLARTEADLAELSRALGVRE